MSRAQRMAQRHTSIISELEQKLFFWRLAAIASTACYGILFFLICN